MAGSVNSDNEDKDDVSFKNSGLSTSFTISFEDDDENAPFKQKKVTRSSNMFVKRHVRTLSLPFSNDYEFVKGESMKCAEDFGKKNFTDEHELLSSNFPKIVKKTMNGTISVNDKNNFHDQNKRSEFIKTDECVTDDDKFNEIITDTESEGGTYTLDKNNKQVQIARKSIDQVFGISSNGENAQNNISADEKFRNKSRMIDEWMERSVTATKSASETFNSHNVSANCLIKSKSYVSKIPSPIMTRRELKLVTKSTKKLVSPNVEKSKSLSGTEAKSDQQLNSVNSGEIDTKCYLQETENIVTALQNRLHSDFQTNKSSVIKKQADEQEKESSASKYTNTRFNRAFSLRRDRMKKVSPVINSTYIPVRTKNLTTVTLKNTLLNEHNGYFQPDKKNIVSKDTSQNKKTSLLVSAATSSTKITKQVGKNDDNLKKKTYLRLKPNGNGIRSNSSLSTQEIEFQNWKRRKSYDPLKAAAEDRKKKSMMHSATGSGFVSTTVLNKKPKSAVENDESGINEKGIMRSASFHGLRNKNGLDRTIYSDENNVNRSTSGRYISSCLSNENSVSSDIPDDCEDDWIIPKPPSSSLQNTPPESVCSRLSLLSNTASCSALHAPSFVTKVNFTTLLNVSQLSQTIKMTISSLTDSLRTNYDNCIQDSETCIQNENNLSPTFTPENKIDSNEFDSDFMESGEKNLDDEEENNIQDQENDENKYNEVMVDHQLRITLDNLRKIHVAVQELQLVCSNK